MTIQEHHTPAHFADESIEDSVELASVLALWKEAADRGWVLSIDRDRMTWRILADDRSAGAGYDPPDEFSVGKVRVHTPDTTFVATGVSSAAVAVGHIRDFLGWPVGAYEGAKAIEVTP